MAQPDQNETHMERTPQAQASLDRQQTLWRPEHSPAAQAYIDRYREETKGKPLDPARFVGTPSGLSHRDIHSVINDRSLGERFFEIHSDMLDPEKSVYIDPFFGDLHGQRAIRAWLVPIMSGQGSGASFDPVFPAAFLDDGEGGTSIDEWMLTQPVNGEWVKIVRGVSVRRYRDGWVRDAVDFFDTTPIRMGMAFREKQGDRVVALPDWPRVPTKAWVRTAPPAPLSAAAAAWRADHAKRPADQPTGLSNRDLHDLLFEQPRGDNFYSEFTALLHPTASVYIDPIFGEVHGRGEIGDWLADVMPKAGKIVFELTEKPVFDGDMSYSEWRQVAILPDGKRVIMTRGSSIRRYKGGYVVYAADYFDTAPFMDPEIQAASAAAGSTLTLDDIRKYRPDIPAAAPDSDILGLTSSLPLPKDAGEAVAAGAANPDVRERLIDIATAEIERTGKATISIREVSRLAGISHNAPYFHFADKQALLMAVATRGFWKLHDEMVIAAQPAATPHDRHRLLGVGYIRFAIANPGLFRLIGNREITGAVPTRELSTARMASAQLFGAAVLNLTSRRQDVVLDPKLAAVAGWSMMQGLATLLIEGQLTPGLLGLADEIAAAESVAGLFTGLLAGDA
ncbi:WHG domain-containing protein [Sphingopyxis sp. KK2]|uniref:WHG domain-containing protein n=1 Tax=Sphingopyxis sp. KK2 TaxID=1855727 RepID=UPI001181B324|nr:WHG domain-containing protein [Sphingopyxis sp. KK2]